MLGGWCRGRPGRVGVIRGIGAVMLVWGRPGCRRRRAVVVAVALYASLPNQLLVGPRFVIPILEGILLVALVATDPRRITRQTRQSRMISLVLIAVIVVTNLVALGQLVHDLVSAEVKGGGVLLLALQVWATNVIAFALIYWELDRGGPVSRVRRSRGELPLADLRFSHDEDRDTVVEVSAGSSEKSDWMPTFVDYLYVSTTNSSAFSPTDTMPLSSRMKMLMAVQATAALITSLLVIARAVSALQ
jgi:uncharacterized membrane protein